MSAAYSTSTRFSQMLSHLEMRSAFVVWLYRDIMKFSLEGIKHHQRRVKLRCKNQTCSLSLDLICFLKNVEISQGLIIVFNKIFIIILLNFNN